MPATKASVTLLASQSVAAGLTKSTAVYGAWVDTRTFYRMCVRWRMRNGASAPGIAPTMVVQTSPDNGITVYDSYLVYGDTSSYNATTGAGDNSNEVSLDDTTMYVRVGVYAHTTNAVTAEASLQEITGM